jgi:hypothetical protein
VPEREYHKDTCKREASYFFVAHSVLLYESSRVYLTKASGPGFLKRLKSLKRKQKELASGCVWNSSSFSCESDYCMHCEGTLGHNDIIIGITESDDSRSGKDRILVYNSRTLPSFL